MNTPYTGGYNNEAAKDGVKRVGAGGVKSGLPLIITGGQKRHDLFHYNFSDLGKFKKQPRPGEVELRVSDKVPQRELMEKIKYVLPRNFCPDCNRTDRMKVGGACNMWTMHDGESKVDLKPGDVVVSIWCQECQMTALYADKKIQLPGNQEIAPENYDEWRLKQIRQIRMDRNIAEFIRNRLIAGDTSIRPYRQGEKEGR